MYIPQSQILVLELFVRNVKVSKQFYLDLGFKVAREEEDFVALKWADSHMIFIDERKELPKDLPTFPQGNVSD